MTGATKYEAVAMAIMRDFRCYPSTDILIASPECTNHSQAKGVTSTKQLTSLWGC